MSVQNSFNEATFCSSAFFSSPQWNWVSEQQFSSHRLVQTRDCGHLTVSSDPYFLEINNFWTIVEKTLSDHYLGSMWCGNLLNVRKISLYFKDFCCFFFSSEEQPISHQQWPNTLAAWVRDHLLNLSLLPPLTLSFLLSIHLFRHSLVLGLNVKINILLF